MFFSIKHNYFVFVVAIATLSHTPIASSQRFSTYEQNSDSQTAIESKANLSNRFTPKSNSSLRNSTNDFKSASINDPVGKKLEEDQIPGPHQNFPPLAITKFQEFVKVSTGKLLPIYGSALFENTPAFATSTTQPASPDYILNPGDEIELQVWGSSNFTNFLKIDPEGKVNLPKVGSFKLAGLKVSELEPLLKQKLATVFANFNLNASIGRLHGIDVYVVGQARKPGSHRLPSTSGLISALFATGGPNENGSMRKISVRRDGKIVTTIDLYKFLSNGDKSSDISLLSGDVIVIAPVGDRVAVTGALDKEAIYELIPGSNINDILQLSGGLPTLASLQKAIIERISPNSKTSRYVKEIKLDHVGQSLPLQDGDLLTLKDISPAFSNVVTLLGPVSDPIRYQWFQGMRLLDLLPNKEALISKDYYRRINNLDRSNTDRSNTDRSNTHDASKSINNSGKSVDARMRGMLDQVNWDYALIERLDREHLKNTLISFNLGKLILDNDQNQNLILEPGDVVTILRIGDVKIPQARQNRLIRIEGEVKAPGIYQAQPGETLPQLIQRAGGLTNQAFMFGIEFKRESVRLQQQKNLDAVTHKLESQMLTQTKTASAGMFEDPTLKALAASQSMQMQNELSKLKSLRSEGRISLELDPRKHQISKLPLLPLEDGDSILIPSTPSFVTAFGAVHNQNVQIYRPGKTVSDVLKSASISSDADTDEIFLLRADGSIISKTDSSSNFLFGGSFESLPLLPGDTIVVPTKIDRESKYSFLTRSLKDWTQILANFGLGLAAWRTL